MSTATYIEKLTLADPIGNSGKLVASLGSRRSADEPADPGDLVADDLQAAINDGSILSFVSGVPKQDVADVLFSVQLASRGASGKFDRFDKTEDWYRVFLEILEHLGWTVEQFAFAREDIGSGEFRMDKAALDIIQAIATQNQLAVLTQTISALRSMSAGDEPIKLLDFAATLKNSGNFQIGTVEKSKQNDVLSMALGAYYFHARDERTKFLFFSWGEKSVDFWTAAQKMTLNSELYAQSRDLVKRKLGQSAADYLAEITPA
jgi:hypothetical protein